MTNHLIALLLVFAAQAASSALSTATIHAAVGNSAMRLVLTASVSDAVKLSVLSGVVALAVSGNWMGIAAAVAGGALGNYLAHKTRLSPTPSTPNNGTSHGN